MNVSNRKYSGPPPASQRPYTCKVCGIKLVAKHVPPGWYSTNRHAGFPDEGSPLPRQIRLGLFCSAVCLARGTLDICKTDVELGGDWVRVLSHTSPKTPRPASERTSP